MATQICKDKLAESCTPVTQMAIETAVDFQSVRYKAFIQKFPRLVEAVSPVVVKFAVNARSKSLVSDYSKTQAEMLHVHQYDRASILMSQISLKIKDNDAHFDDFIAILQDLNLTNLAYELKRTVDPITSGDSDSGSATGIQVCGFQCPCGLCSFQSYFEDRSKCSKKETFPFLNVTHLNEAKKGLLRRQLIRDANNMSNEFLAFSGKIFKTLERNATPISDIVNSIFLSAGQSLPRQIEDRHGDQLDATTTIPGIHRFLVQHKYISFINFRILEKIVSEHCRECQADLDSYNQKLQIFCKRSIFEVPAYAIMSPATSLDQLLVVKVIDELWFGGTQRDNPNCPFTLRDIDAVTNKVAEVIELRHGYFGLVDVGAGCIQLTFSILSYQEAPIFPLTTSQLSELIHHGIIVLYQPKPQSPTNGQATGGQSHEETSCRDISASLVPPTNDTSLDLGGRDEEPSEAIPIQFNLHTSYYNDFFLLRTLITINGTPAEIKIDPSGSSLIHHPKTGIEYLLSKISHGIASKLTKKHGVYHIDTFYHEEAPLFSVVFPSQSALRKFLENKEQVESDLTEVLSTQFKTEPEANRPTPGQVIANQGLTSGQDLSEEEPHLQFSINAELFLASPTHSTEQGQQPSWPVMRKITLATFEHYIEKWQQSKLFDFDKSMFSDENLDQQSSQEVEEAKLKDLQRELKGVDTWFQLGLELGIPDDELRVIRRDNILSGVEQCLLEVLIHWGDREKPTWTKVVQALVRIGRPLLAENISMKYGVTTSELPDVTTFSDADTQYQATEHQLSQTQSHLDVAIHSRDKLIENIETDLSTRLDGQNSSLTIEIEALENELKCKHEEIEYLKQSQKKMKNFWQKIVERMERDCLEKITELQQQLTTKKNELIHIQEQLAQKEKELEEKKADVKKKSFLVKQLREEVEKLKQSFSEQQQEINQRLIESNAYFLGVEKHLEEVKLQLEQGKQEVALKKKEIETHTQNLAIKDKQIKQLSETIKELNKTEMDNLKDKAISEDELSQFKLKKAQEQLKICKSSIPDISKCTLSLPQEQLEKHTPSQLQVCLFDEDGDPCSGSHHIDTKLILLADDSIVAGTFSKPVKANPGEYVVSFTPTRAGDCEIQVTVNGTPLSSGALHVVVYSYLQPDISKCTVSLPQEQLVKHTLSHLRVCLFDEDGDPCSGSHHIDTKLTLLANDSIVAGTFSKPVKNNPGEYGATFTPTRAGDCKIQVTVDGISLTTQSLHVWLHPEPEPAVTQTQHTQRGILRGFIPRNFFVRRRPLLPVVQPPPAYIHDVIQKMEESVLYANCSKKDLNELADNITNPELLKLSYFSGYQDYKSPAASPMSSLRPSVGFQPILQEEEPAKDILHVKVLVTTPSSGTLSLKVPSLESQGACSGGADSVVTMIEEKYRQHILKASIEVNGQILTWGPDSLIVPQGRPIPDTGESFAPALLSLDNPEHGPKVQKEPECREVYSLEPCPGHKLNNFLKLVSNYNKKFIFNVKFRNSMHFILDALQALGYQNPPPFLTKRYSEYLSALKQKKSKDLPSSFKDHASLEYYLHLGTNFVKAKKNKFDIEFLLNHYVAFHWEEKSQAREPGKWVCQKYHKEQCLMEILESEITPENLLLNEFR